MFDSMTVHVWGNSCTHYLLTHPLPIGHIRANCGIEHCDVICNDDGNYHDEDALTGKWQLLVADLEFNGTKCATPAACTQVLSQREAFDLFYNRCVWGWGCAWVLGDEWVCVCGRVCVYVYLCVCGGVGG